MVVCHEHLVLSPAPESVGTGRHLVQRLLPQWGLEDLVDVAALLVSEALSNAVIHAGTTVTLDVYTDERLVIEVRDTDPTAVLTPVAAAGLAALMREPDLTAESGRGLLLIANLADRWGIEQEVAGKTVWFSLDLPPTWDGVVA